MNSVARPGLLITGALIASVGSDAAFAQTGADFYKGKTVTYIASTAPGGGYDKYGRLVAEFMQKHLPGSTFVVKNVPGAGHLIGANTIYASKPDGLTIGIFNTGLIYNQIIKKEGVQFDLAKMSWVGKAASGPHVMVIAAQSPIKTFRDLQAQQEPVKFATGGIGSDVYAEVSMISKVFKLPINLLTGYNGGEELLAMRRGEVTGSMGSRSSLTQFVRNGYGRLIIQIGGDDQDVPQLSSMVTDSAGQALVALIRSQTEIGRLTAGPPGIPEDRLNALRDSYRKALEDAELLAKAQKLEIPIDPAYGDTVLKMVKEALDQPPETITLIKEALEKPRDKPGSP